MKKLFILFVLFMNLLSVVFANETSVSEFRISNPASLTNNTVNLDTKWDFYWKKFVLPSDFNSEPDLKVSVPSIWNAYDLPEEDKIDAKKGKGAGTYRLKITNLKPNTEYAFQTYQIAYTAFTVLANEKIIFRSGYPYCEYIKTKAQQYKDFATFYSDDNGEVLLTFYISNNDYRKGGLLKSVKLQEAVSAKNNFYNDLSKFSILNGILITIIVYSFLLYLMKKERPNLYLSLFVLSILSRLISQSFPILKVIAPEISFTLMIKIEYLALFMAPCFYMLYMYSLDKNIFRHFKVVYFLIPAPVFLLLDILLSLYYVNRLVPIMQFYLFFIILINLYVLLNDSIRHQNPVCIVGISTFLIVGLGAGNDILLNNFITLFKTSFLPGSFVIYAISQITFLAYIQNKNMLKVEELNEYLHTTNTAYYRFVPKEFLNLLNKDDITQVHAGEFKSGKMAIMSADIRNFTSLSEKMSEMQVFDMLNSYLKRIAPIIRKYNGIIEKYLGDGIIALFPESSEAALNCAIEMQEEMIELRKEFLVRDLPEIKIGIGVHYGNVVIGTGGDNERMTEISLSKDIDITVKAEAATKTYKMPIIVTQQALEFAAIEAKQKGQKFNFYGKKLLTDNGITFFSIYSEKTGNIL